MEEELSQLQESSCSLLLCKRLRCEENMEETKSYTGSDEGSTGLSPKLSRMLEYPSVISPFTLEEPHFCIEDGIETFCMDKNDTRTSSVGMIYNSLDRRLENAARFAGLDNYNRAVLAWRQKIALRAAELEFNVNQMKENGNLSTDQYHDSIYRLIQWIDNATNEELRNVLEKLNHSTAIPMEDV
jgi:hypothetical protein